MSNNTTIKMSQGYEVLKPKSDQAFPIPCNEWDVLRSQIEQLTIEPWLFHTLGSLLLGASLATFISVVTDTIPTKVGSNSVTVAWAVVVTCGITGLACLYFSHKERQVHKSKAQLVLTQMKLIEERFEREKI